MDIKQEPDSYYDTPLEPDVILIDSSGRSYSLQGWEQKFNSDSLINRLSKTSKKKPTNSSYCRLVNNNSSKEDGPNGSIPTTILDSSANGLNYVKEKSGDPLEQDLLTIRRTSTSPRDSGPLQQCPICKKHYKRISAHLQTHDTAGGNPERPYCCTYCNKVFKNLSNLTVHTRSHTGFKPYICEICHKGFTQSGNLVHHMRIHTGSRPYRCPICDRAFTQPGNLSNHMRLHSQEKPFNCHLCDRSFTQSSNLNSHIRNNHKEYMQARMFSQMDFGGPPMDLLTPQMHLMTAHSQLMPPTSEDYMTSNSSNMSSEIVNMSSETVNMSSETVNMSSETVNMSSETVNMSSETVNMSSETVNMSSETVPLVPKTELLIPTDAAPCSESPEVNDGSMVNHDNSN